MKTKLFSLMLFLLVNLMYSQQEEYKTFVDKPYVKSNLPKTKDLSYLLQSDRKDISSKEFICYTEQELAEIKSRDIINISLNNLPIATLNGLTDMILCKSSLPQTITLDASGSSSSLPPFSIVKYEWSWGDGTTTTTTTPTATHTYSQYGIFRASVRVYDNNFIATPVTGCGSTNSALKYVKILPPPAYNAATTTINTTCNQTIDLQALARSSNINEVTFPIQKTAIRLIDGIEYEINLSGYFVPETTVNSNNFPIVKFNIEHFFACGLTIDLIAPNGQTLRLHNKNLTEKSFQTNMNKNDGNIPIHSTEYTLAIDDLNLSSASNVPSTVSYDSLYNSQYDPHYAKLQSQNSLASYTRLIGAPLNGIWKLKISNDKIYEDTILTDWSITFPSTCYAKIQNINTTLTNMTWSSETGIPAVVSQNTMLSPFSNIGPNNCPTNDCIGTLGTSNATVGPFTQAGTYTYTNTVTNSLGYTNTQTFSINVTCPNTLTLVSTSNALTQNNNDKQ